MSEVLKWGEFIKENYQDTKISLMKEAKNKGDRFCEQDVMVELGKMYQKDKRRWISEGLLKPAAKKPATRKPATKAKKPAAKKPSTKAKKPAAKKLATKKLSTKSSDFEFDDSGLDFEKIVENLKRDVGLSISELEKEVEAAKKPVKKPSKKSSAEKKMELIENPYDIPVEKIKQEKQKGHIDAILLNSKLDLAKLFIQSVYGSKIYYVDENNDFYDSNFILIPETKDPRNEKQFKKDEASILENIENLATIYAKASLSKKDKYKGMDLKKQTWKTVRRLTGYNVFIDNEVSLRDFLPFKDFVGNAKTILQKSSKRRITPELIEKPGGNARLYKNYMKRQAVKKDFGSGMKNRFVASYGW